MNHKTLRTYSTKDIQSLTQYINPHNNRIDGFWYKGRSYRARFLADFPKFGSFLSNYILIQDLNSLHIGILVVSNSYSHKDFTTRNHELRDFDYYKDVLISMYEQGSLTVLIPPEYDDIIIHTDLDCNSSITDLFQIKKKGKWGILGLTDVMFDLFAKGYNGQIICLGPKVSGVVSEEGDIFVPYQYDNIEESYCKKHYKIELNGKYGIVNSIGETIVPLYYDLIEYCNKNYKIKLNGKFGMVNTINDVIIPLQYDSLHNVGSDLICAKVTNTCKIFKLDGNILFTIECSDVEYVGSSNILIARFPFFTRFINLKGDFISESLTFEHIEYLNQDLFDASISNFHWLINSKGEILSTKFTCDYIYLFNHSSLLVRTGNLYSIYSHAGDMIYGTFEIIDSYSGLSRVKSLETYGLIDFNSKKIISRNQDYMDVTRKFWSKKV